MGSEASSMSRVEFDLDELLYEVGDEELNLQVHGARLEGNHVSVFSYRIAKRGSIGHRIIQNYKVLRHPLLLRYVNHVQAGTSCHVITETCTPLSLCVDCMSSSEIAAGLYNILCALKFLHTHQTLFSHNNVCVNSIFVAPDGQWKLGRLECALPFSENSAQSIEDVSRFCDADICSPDLKYPYAHNRDMFAFAKLCETFLDRLDDQDSSAVEALSSVVQQLLTSRPSEMLTASDILQCQPLFKLDLIQILQFLSDIAMKTHEEKHIFFLTLMDRLQNIPIDVVAKKVVKPLLTRFVIYEEDAMLLVIPHLFIPKGEDCTVGLLPVELYSKYMLPLIQRLFTVRELTVRRLLLSYFKYYYRLFPNAALQHYIMPLMIQGLHDSHEDIVISTFGTISLLVTVLGAKAVIGTERRDIFKDEQPVKSSPQPQKVEPFCDSREEPISESSGKHPIVQSASDRNDRVVPSRQATYGSDNISRANGHAGQTGGLQQTTASEGSTLNHEQTDTKRTRLISNQTELNMVNPDLHNLEEVSPSSDTSDSCNEEGWDNFDPLPVEGSPQPTQESHTASLKVAVLPVKVVPKDNGPSRKNIIDDFNSLDIKSNIGKIKVMYEDDFFADMTPGLGVNVKLNLNGGGAIGGHGLHGVTSRQNESVSSSSPAISSSAEQYSDDQTARRTDGWDW